MAVDRGQQAGLETILSLARAGHFTLPEEVTAAAEAVGVLERARDAARAAADEAPSPEIVEDTLASETVEQVFDGKPVPANGKRWSTAREKHESLEATFRILIQAAELAVSRWGAAFWGQIDTVTLNHLRPALEEVLSEARGLVPKLGGGRSASEVLDKGEEARRAWLRLSELYERYSAIRQAWGIVHRQAYAPRSGDTAGLFANYSERVQGSGPNEPAARMAWTVSETKPWLPLPSEQNQALEDERERNAERQREATARSRVGSGA